MTELPATPWEGDLMNRRQAANFLQSFLDQNSSIKVLNVNSAWGSGKTFFIQNWHVALKQARVSVYFNAWEADYTGDPFVSLAANIKEQLKEQSETVAYKRFSEFTKSAAKTLVSAAPAVGKGLLKRFLGVDADEVADAALDAAEELAEKAVESIINKNAEVTKQVRAFRRVLGDLSRDVSQAKTGTADGEPVPPVYIFIDELDRCRPTYAIELLERVKHFFSTENCIFIVATDSTQLKHSIRAVYGAEFDSERYLRRFFDVDFSLDNTDLSQWVQMHINENYTGNDYALTEELDRALVHSGYEKFVVPLSEYARGSKDGFVLTSAQIIFLAVSRSFGFELRDMESLKVRVDAIIASGRLGEPDFFWICYLCALKHYSLDCYNSFMKSADGFVSKDLPESDIYTGFHNVNVHALALIYKEALKLGRGELVEQSAYLDSIGVKAKVFGAAMLNANLSSYSRYVELAGSLSV